MTIKVVNVALGIALAIVSIVGLLRGATPWLGFVNACVAALSIVAGVFPASAKKEFHQHPDSGIGMLLFMVWGGALAAGASSGLVWSTFAFGLLYCVPESVTAVRNAARVRVRI